MSSQAFLEVAQLRRPGPRVRLAFDRSFTSFVAQVFLPIAGAMSSVRLLLLNQFACYPTVRFACFMMYEETQEPKSLEVVCCVLGLFATYNHCIFLMTPDPARMKIRTVPYMCALAFPFFVNAHRFSVRVQETNHRVIAQVRMQIVHPLLAHGISCETPVSVSLHVPVDPSIRQSSLRDSWVFPVVPAITSVFIRRLKTWGGGGGRYV